MAVVLPADCFLCRASLPWRQSGSVCQPCWQRLVWSPGVRLRPGAVRTIFWAAEYTGTVRRLVHGFKFQGMDYLGAPLGERAADMIRPLLGAGPLPRPDIVVPVPLHWWRQYRRGYNQAILLARPICEWLGVPMVTGFLTRQRRGRSQMGLSRHLRLRSLAGCFRAHPTATQAGERHRLVGRTILLVDDVVTTGATLEACAGALLAAGAGAILACTLARTPEPTAAPGLGALKRSVCEESVSSRAAPGWCNREC